MSCADFGCNIGGFTDCLLQHGAARVYAIDTGYGTLDYKLRIDERVVVMERTNALHAEPRECVDLVTIDLAWTPQRFSIPTALNWPPPPHTRHTPPTQIPTPQSSSLGGGAEGSVGGVVTLIKPHYELSEAEKEQWLIDGKLDHERAEMVTHRVVDAMPSLGVEVVAYTRSPITGGKSSRRGTGNIEFLAYVKAL